MFCTTLRRRLSLTTLVPTLTSTDGLALKENDLRTHDLEISLTVTTSSIQRVLRLLIVTPSQCRDASLASTTARIEHFIALTGGTDLAIVFLLKPDTHSTAPSRIASHHFTPQAPQESLETGFITARNVHAEDMSHSGMTAYWRLQQHLLFDTDASNIPSIPILPLSNPRGLPALLKAYTMTLTARHPKPSRAPNPAFDVLPYCTTALSPLTKEEVIRVSDVFGGLKDLAMLAEVDEHGRGGDEERLAMLVDALGEEGARGMVEFWKEEWVAE